MLQSILNGVRGVCGKVWGFVKSAAPAVVFGAVAVVGGGELFAQTTASTIEYESIVDFGDIFETIREAIGPVVVGALGLGLAIWGARYVFSIIKSMGR